MKKIYLIIVLVIVGFGWWFIAYHNSSKKPVVKLEPAVTHPDASNATFQFEDGPITLKNGDAVTNVTPNGEITEDTTLTNNIAYGDINGDGKNDTAVLLVQSGEGSGVFLYIGAYVSGLVQYSGTNTIFIGDRVIPKTISIDKNGIITVTYLDRNSGEAMADDPTVLTIKHYAYKNGQLEQI